MTKKIPHWGSLELGPFEADHSSVRSSISTELPETRIFLDQFYRELMDTGHRIEIDRLVESRDDLPWFLVQYESDA